MSVSVFYRNSHVPHASPLYFLSVPSRILPCPTFQPPNLVFLIVVWMIPPGGNNMLVGY